MKYLCLGYHEQRAWEALSEREREVLAQESAAYEQVLQKNGHPIQSTAVHRAVAIMLRFANGKVCVTDGPFAEKEESLGGLILLEARDLNHAIQLMSQLPCMRLGGRLEIRPINETFGGVDA